MSLPYTPLDIESYQIRMISLSPGPPGSIIQCKLKKQSLVDEHEYAALSYCWGDQNTRRDIIVNNVQITVTVNLEEALQRLRRLNVTRVWVDALCINQNDNQEKSHQIRNMVSIYSKAITTYTWLGEQEFDNAAIALQFLQRASTNNMKVEDLWPMQPQHRAIRSHRHVDLPSTRFDGFQTRTLDDYFETLFDLFGREYWKRRWIIQEVAAAAQVQVICGKETLSLGRMIKALEKCQNSKHWRPRHDTEYRYLQRVLSFRDLYHNGKSLTLCEAVFSTQDSLSKDERDKVFALIGICCDGTELVPTPSYHQTPAAVVRDMSRELLRKYMCFDIILVDQRKKSTSEGLPTWAPNWLSPTLSQDAHLIASRPSLLNHTFAAQCLGSNANMLQVQGVSLGTILGVTSTLKSKRVTQGAKVRHKGFRGAFNRDQSHYYGRMSWYVSAAILECLTEGVQCGTTGLHWFSQFVQGRTVCKSDVSGSSNEANDAVHTVYRRWLDANEDFQIYGQRLQRWLEEGTLFYWTSQLFETMWGLALLVLLDL